MISFLALSIGGIIYLGARPMSLNMFRWFGIGEHTRWLMRLRESFPSVSEWVVYALPDGLWSFAYTLTVATIWDFDIRRGWPLICGIPIIGIVSEMMQLFGWIQGVFDPGDLIAYAAGLAAGLIAAGGLRIKD